MAKLDLALFTLLTILPHRHYTCWQLFVKSCYLFCRRSVHISQVEEADHLMLEFCNMFETLYGKEHCTVNIHLHGHLKDCITDFGPVYSFWLFSFERLNGVLGSYHTNCHDISLQLMRRFLLNRGYGCNNWPQEYASDFSSLLSHCPYTKGSLRAAEECTNQEIEALPPVAECAWLPHEKDALNHICKDMAKSSSYPYFKNAKQ